MDGGLLFILLFAAPIVGVLVAAAIGTVIWVRGRRFVTSPELLAALEAQRFTQRGPGCWSLGSHSKVKIEHTAPRQADELPRHALSARMEIPALLAGLGEVTIRCWCEGQQPASPSTTEGMLPRGTINQGAVWGMSREEEGPKYVHRPLSPAMVEWVSRCLAEVPTLLGNRDRVEVVVTTWPTHHHGNVGVEFTHDAAVAQRFEVALRTLRAILHHFDVR